MVPNFETVCLLFARCDLDMKGVRFPSGHEAFRAAFSKTVEHIRSRYLGERATPLYPESWECLRLVLRDQAVLDSIAGTEKAAGGDARGVLERLRHAAGAIAREVETRFPTGRIKDAEGVQRTIGEWLIPFVLFYTVIPPAQRGC
jgi:hypothetical protein